MTEERMAVIDFDWQAAKARVAGFKRWEENPSRFENKETIKAEEYRTIKDRLVNQFSERVQTSGLAGGRELSEEDLKLVHEILETIMPTEKEIISDERRRPWTPDCLEHAYQTEVVAASIAEQTKLDILRVRIKAAIHDIGRFASHHPLIHGLVGRQLLKELGFHPDLRRTTLAHLESGVGPYVMGINQESWSVISQEPKKLEKFLASVSPEEIVIALADVAKEPGGKIVDPLEGAQAACKSKPWRGEQDAQMRIGFVKALKDFLKEKYQVNFEKAIALAQKRYQRLSHA
jgi:HD superfamily phosphodiesterase